MAIAAAINWIANAAVAFSYPYLADVIGGYTFFIFTGLLVLFVVFTFLCVPETKGKTIPEIQSYFVATVADSGSKSVL